MIILIKVTMLRHINYSILWGRSGMKRTSCRVQLAPERPGTMCQKGKKKKKLHWYCHQFTNEGAKFLATYAHIHHADGWSWATLLHFLLTCVLNQVIWKKKRIKPMLLIYISVASTS